jgi:hypothetical protein
VFGKPELFTLFGLLGFCDIALPADSLPAGVACLLEDNGSELLPLLTNNGGDLGEGHVEKEVMFSGTSALKITVYQRYFNLIPGWAYRVTESPKEGEYRYLRFAWKSDGSTGMMLQLHDDKDWHIRYTAGANKFGWESRFVGETPPKEWTVVTVDLFKDFGEREIHGIALTAFDGSGGYFDHIYFGRTIAALDAIDATGLSERREPLVLTPEQVGEHFDNLISADASVAYRSFWTLAAAGESARIVLEGKLGGDVAEVNAAKIAEWIKQLDHEEYLVRERATAELIAHYELARTAIDEEMKGTTSFEVRSRLGMIVAKGGAPLSNAEQSKRQALRLLKIIAERDKQKGQR